jgi:hypothetical protein
LSRQNVPAVATKHPAGEARAIEVAMPYNGGKSDRLKILGRRMKTNILLSLLGIAAVVAIGWLFLRLWSLSGSLDSDLQRSDLTERLMQRKAAATIGIRDALAEGNLARARKGASELRRISETAEWYLTDERYAALSADFRQALERLDRALSEDPVSAGPDAYDELIASCMTCHQQATQSRIDPGLLQP